MNSADLLAAAPFIILGLAPILVMLLIAFRRRHSMCVFVSMVSLIAALYFTIRAGSIAPHPLTHLFVIDAFGIFYMSVVLIVTAALIVLGLPYIAHKDSQPEEYYVLLLLAAGGACTMAVATHFASFYLGLEVLSVSQYGLTAYVRRDRRGTEAGLKYLLLAAGTAAFLLFGIALVYAELGTMELSVLAHMSFTPNGSKVALLGVAMIFASIGFKLSIAPFHLWTPDVYEGAPAPVAAFVSTVSKIGVLAVLVRYFALDAAPVSHSLSVLIAFTAAISMIVGNVLALIQHNIKRLLAYSSIAHMGYLLAAFLAAGSLTSDTVAFYMVSYCAAIIGIFGVLMALSVHSHRAHDIERIEDYRGLYWSHPVHALVLAVGFLSLAGIPLTAGFLGKLYVVVAGAQNAHWWLLTLLALTSTVGAYYYLRFVVMLFMKPAADAPTLPEISDSYTRQAVLIGLAIASIVLGVYPAPLLAIIHAMYTAG